MGSALVSARVNRAKKETGAEILASLGATTTELINGAYDYLLERRQLPGGAQATQPASSDWSGFVADSTVEVDWQQAGEGADYRTMIREGKRADYESLA